MGSLASEAPSDWVLSEEQKAHFLEHGYIKVPACFTREEAATFSKNLWPRLSMSPTDKSTWTGGERINMPWHNHIPVEEFAPKAWSAMCQLLGGDERIADGMWRSWSDGFIVNFGKEEYAADAAKRESGKDRGEELRELDNWHNDGDFFVHFLDSQEQGLLVIPLWSDIEPRGGGTALACDGIKYIAQHLYEHPEGVTPWMRSVDDPTHDSYEGRDFWQSLAADKSKVRGSSIVEATGQIGDVFFLHPLMLHSASKNELRNLRIITNPPVSLKEPFCFDREDPSHYSLVEQKTLRDLGKPEGLKGWKISKERREWIPERVKNMDAMKKKELERLNSGS
ncbi:Uncharacterized protein BP5553_04498 [Venustampulla echinocandica]|uniref:Clavaminate synthase-like protein n=1 Tax=Venustampulla echinocandica TaxID=2656787 RepID=A0A370TNG2_9HELO|nr:Uncharacterized protein BP5553_04498 [Venustampulla echinocandica]RDL37065.1 Uncharacterized protein BP5553_04498 [Venustampulla echinocandica]